MTWLGVTPLAASPHAAGAAPGARIKFSVEDFRYQWCTRYPNSILKRFRYGFKSDALFLELKYVVKTATLHFVRSHSLIKVD